MPRGGFGGHGFGGRGFGGWGHGFGMRRFGVPMVMPMMGGYGYGMGSPLLTSLLAGGVGYALGSNTAQQNEQVPVYQQQYPPYPYPYQGTPVAPYQGTPIAPSGQPTSTDNGKLAQLQLLGELRESGTITEDEFESEKQRILNS